MYTLNNSDGLFISSLLTRKVKVNKVKVENNKNQKHVAGDLTNLINYVSIEDGLQRTVKGRDCGMHKKAAVRKEPGVPQEWGVLEPHLNAGGADENWEMLSFGATQVPRCMWTLLRQPPRCFYLCSHTG
ncbi:hypothetical protein M0R45_038482 [Rubus argutus]|uniref:Uncharacterized protein n=1 Tax=Rubus argutus TaxID=59490 RepID=A0AAW1W3W8_RUBAR